MKKTLYSLKQAQKDIPNRKKTDHKASAGKSLIIAGSEGMFGAAVLASSAAARIGSGYVILLTESQKFNFYKNPDFLVKDSKTTKIADLNFDAVGIGPGLGNSKLSLSFLKELLKLNVNNVVIDADALNLCAHQKIKQLPKTWIATPHEGELARLLNIGSHIIKKNRIKAVLMAQKKLGCIVLLKGHKTLVATENKLFEIQSGNAALAKAGTGDVLTGLITGLLAQGLPAEKAVCFAAFVHGRVADQWLKDKKDILSLLASDLVSLIPKELARIRKN